jgi:hypothetical protein
LGDPASLPQQRGLRGNHCTRKLLAEIFFPVVALSVQTLAHFEQEKLTAKAARILNLSTDPT